MTPNLIRIAVASDLHAHSNSDPSPSHLNISMPESLTFQHPISALLELIRAEKLVADILLSPGDLGDKADAEGIAYAWAALGKLASALECGMFAATAGNHDLDSRFKENDHNPTHILKGLVPSFPLQNDALDDKYWSRAYAIRDIGPMRIVLLNSSSSHGYGEIEKNHGRVDDLTLKGLAKDLRALGPASVNILLCHHHPHHHSELSLGEADVMKQGQQLLDMLGCGEYGRWLVIHGHKHHPKIAYAAGGSSSPIVFAAGSLCAILSGLLQTAARNQFYLIEIDPSACQKYGLVGTIRSWDWSPGNGWIKASTLSSGLPALSGFGNRQDPMLLANEVAAIVNQSIDTVSWTEIAERVREVGFLLPQDLAALVKVLEQKYCFEVSKDGTEIVQVGRLTS